MVWAEILAFLKALPALYGFWQSLRDTFGDNATKVLVRTEEAYQKLKSVGSEDGAFDAAKAVQDVIGKL